MARALCIQIATAAPSGLGKVSTPSSNCKVRLSTVFGGTLRLDCSTAQAVNSISKIRINSMLRTDENTGHVVGSRFWTKTTAPASVQISVPIPKAVDEQELNRREVLGDANLAVDPDRELLEKSMDFQNRGKELNHPYANLHVGERWPEIQGRNKWAGLLDPIDPVLRGEVMRYGDFAQVSYDAFDHDTHSKYCGSCKYNKKHLLEKVGLSNRGYEVTDYLYATSGFDHPISSFFKRFDTDDSDDWYAEELWDKESNWMGFVAVATDEAEIARLGRRDIVIVWRGTVTKLEWVENLRDYLSPSAFDFDNSLGSADIKVEAGFLNIYVSKNVDSLYTQKSAREQIHIAVRRLVEKYKDDKLSITVTGHSLGSALAHLSAYDLAENDFHYREGDPRHHNYSIPITVYSFAGPRVGNDAFRDRLEELGVKILRLVNKHDKVPKIPGLLLNEKLDMLEEKAGFLWNWIENLPWTYTHCGVLLELDNLLSPFLKKSKDALNAHNLEAYIHLLNGYHGKDQDFKLAVDRDIALINKNSDFLRPKHAIPPAWWQEENKGLKRTEGGHWIPRTRDPEDVPEYESLNKESSVNISRDSS